MSKKLIKNATVINEGREYLASVLIAGEKIEEVIEGECPEEIANQYDSIDATGLWLIPGVIDGHVHFRDPGLTQKGDLYTESRAAVAGGVTTFMDMPNTIPQTTTIEALNDKFSIAADKSLINYSFYMGTTNDNMAELLKDGIQRACGIKVFFGSSTGNMLVDNEETLNSIFSSVDKNKLIAVHCEDEATIEINKAYYISQFGENLPIGFHSLIRNDDACFKSSFKAVSLALKHEARLHLLHLSTLKEMSLLSTIPLEEKRITAEACVHHLWFEEKDYDRYRNKIKWNPAIKRSRDRDALRDGVKTGLIDVISTDHAPHLWEEKQGNCLEAVSGGPLVQHSLYMMLELCKKGVFTKEEMVQKMCHNPALLFNVKDRGYIKKGYYADLVLLEPNKTWKVEASNILYKCGWSPMEGRKFSTKVMCTFVNGEVAFINDIINEENRGKEIQFKN